ncbi:MAG: winged helix-turn-helix domain-containing protein, partial [Pseudomonadota bacterium]
MTHRTTFGAWTVDFAANRLSRNGQEAVLDPQAMDVLATLLKADGETVSADELLEQVWGARQVEPNAIHGAIHRIRQALGDSAREPRYIATVPKRGYRTVAAIESAATVEQPPDENARWLRRAAIALIVALPLCAPLVWRSADRPLAAQAAKSAEHSPPSLAVLPFTSAEEREDLNFLGHGLASALLSELVRIPELRVIAQNSSFSSQLEQLTSEEVAERLSVSYVLQGQLAKHQDLYRLGLTLVDARRNAVVWADAFSGALIDLNRVDKTVVPKVLAALNVRATAAEFSNESHVGGTTFAAYARAHYLLGLGDYSRTDHLDEAQRQLDISLTEAPDFVPALLAKARLLLQRWRAGVDDRDTSQDRESLVSQALVIDPEHPVALAYRAWSLFNRRGGDYPTAARYYERSFSIDPTNTESLRGLCTFYLTSTVLVQG